MKQALACLLALGMVFSLCACGGETDVEEAVSPIVVNGEERAAKDFLIESLRAYIQSDEYLAREAEYEQRVEANAQPFAVSCAFELKLDGYGSGKIPLHFLMVKVSCDIYMDGGAYDSLSMAIDYDTGTVYSRFNTDASWLHKSEKEQAIYIAVEGGCFADSNYNGDPIFQDSEIHISLTESDIAEINQALTAGNAVPVSADPEPKEAPVRPTAEPAQEDVVPAGSGQYVVLTESPELFTKRVLDDAAVAALKDADPETLREEISTPADFAAWLDTQQATYFSNVICNEEGQRMFGADYAFQWYKEMMSTTIASSLAVYILGDDIPGIGTVAVNMDYDGGVMLCGNVIPVDDGCYVFSLDAMSQRWQQTTNIMKEVFPLLRITELTALIGYCGSEDDISCPGGAMTQAFYFQTDADVVLDCHFGSYTPQNPEDVVEFYRDEAYLAGGEERETGHIKPEFIDRYAISRMLGGTTLTAEEAYALPDMEPEDVKEQVKTVGDVLMYMLAAKIGDCGGDRCMTIDGEQWHYNLNAFEVMDQRLANCGASANLANYLLEGDYEEIGFILHAYYIGNGGGHVYNYIRYEGKYYIVDLSWFIFSNYRPENDFPVMELDRLEDYGKRVSELYDGVCMVVAHTSPGQHFPNVFDDENNAYAIPAGTAYTVLYQENGPGCYQLAEYPLDQRKLDWTIFG